MWARIEGRVAVEVSTVDPEGRFHPSFIWVSCPPEVVPGMQYDGEKFEALPTAEAPQAPALSPDELATIALTERDRLLWVTTIRIAPLQDTIDLNEATADEVENLKQWKRYRVLLSRIEQQTNYPFNVEWPDLPQATSQQVEVRVTPQQLPQSTTLARKVADFILLR